MARGLVCGVLLLALGGVQGGTGKPATALQGLRPFNDFVGEWKCIGYVGAGKKDFWNEKMAWEWQFKGKDAWMKVVFAESKHYRDGELRYLPATGLYRLTVRDKDNKELTFEGSLKDKTLTLEREDAGRKEKQRLVFNLLHANRFTYNYFVQQADKILFTRLYQVGATKEGIPFANAGDGRPECIVSGGLGTIAVSYKGMTYYVCCSGCRDEFKENPERYIKEFNEKKAKK